MVNLPILQSLDVVGYGLYPGDSPSNPGLHIRFAPGLTLVLGANGLGKTTLVTMLYRLLVGPHDIPALARGNDLGNANRRIIRLNTRQRRTFAQRVSDGAAQATAQLVFDVGGEEVTVERNLRDITLRSFKVGNATPSEDEIEYQDQMAKLANVPAFGDWILLLRYIVFYFEDRLSLIWDPTAQRQLLRILFLEPDQADDWAIREREILRADSESRNLHAVATSEENNLASDEVLAASGPATRAELQELEQDQQKAHDDLDEINSQLSDVEAGYERAQLRFLTLEQERESRYRELERAQIHALVDRLPRHSDSARYILSRLLTEAQCLVCGNNVPDVAQSMQSRMHNNECVVCGSGLLSEHGTNGSHFDDFGIPDLDLQLQRITVELESARNILDEAEAERNRTINAIRNLRSSIADRRARLETLLSQLPPDESDLYTRRREFVSLRGRIEVLQRDLNAKRAEFDDFVRMANANIERRSIEVQDSFVEYARQFLFEECRLIWSPQLAQLGQSGRRFYFPSFELELGGSDFSLTLRRSGPDDVSESQREFIDISFRIALAKVATQRQVTSLVMDAPESSLDAVFVNRAARVLGKFGRSQLGNRLVVTSNLVAGDLIPALLREAAHEGNRAERVVNLFTIATPTAAVRDLRKEYEDVMQILLNRADEPESP